MLVIADFMEKRPLTRRHLGLLLFVVASMGVYAWPHGPYAAMLADLEQAHLKRLLQAGPYLMAVPLLGGVALMWVQRKWHWRPSWADAVAASLERRRTAVGLGLLCIVFTALAMQAYLLPAQAWLPYGGSWLRFVFFQRGAGAHEFCGHAASEGWWLVACAGRRRSARRRCCCRNSGAPAATMHRAAAAAHCHRPALATRPP